jgi:hypothetical protein
VAVFVKKVEKSMKICCNVAHSLLFMIANIIQILIRKKYTKCFFQKNHKHCGIQKKYANFAMSLRFFQENPKSDCGISELYRITKHFGMTK